MRTKSLPSLSLFLLPLGGTLPAEQAPAPEAAPAAAIPAIAPFQEDSLLRRGKLDNGFGYIIRPTQEPRGQACLRLHVSIGSLNESEETRGISHFIEHMVFNGSRNFRNGELIPAMQERGLGFGGDANAYTGMQQTVYTIDLPNLKPETVEFALTILRDFADGAELADEAIEHERGIIMSELRQRDSAANRADLELMRKLVAGTRVPDYPPIGAEEVILNCPPATIRQYYRDNYVPSRMTLVITGDVDPATAEQWVRTHFGSMEARPEPPRPSLGTPADTGAGSFVIPHAESANSTITMAVISPWTQRADTPEQRVADLPLKLACSMLNRRLSRMARRPDCPFLSASLAAQESVYGAAELFALRVITRPGQWQEGMAAAEAELRRAIVHGFSAEEIREAAGAINARCRKSLNGWGKITAESVAKRLLRTLDDQSLFLPPTEEMRAFALAFEPIFANPALCSEALGRAYEAERTKLVLSGRVAEGASPESLAAAYVQARRQEVAPLAEEKTTPFAYGYVGEPGRIVAERCHGELGITTMTLSNGVRLNLKPTAHGTGRIFVSAAVDGGTLRIPRVPALREMIESVMSRSGLEAHGVEELSRIFAGHHVDCVFRMDDARFTFSGNTSPADLDFECKLLCAAILHPGFSREGEQQLRRTLPVLLQHMETTPLGAFSKQSSLAIFGDDSRFIPPTAEEFAAVNADTVREVMTPFLQKGAIEVTLVGDFRLDTALPILLNSFGAMPQRNADFSPIDEAARRVDFAPWGKRALLRYSTELDKTIVARVFPAGNGRDGHRNRRLELLRRIAAERLFAAIRAELGESYAPSMMLETREDYDNAATFTASSFGVKRNLAAVDAAMDAVFASLGRGEISEKEFRQALLPYIEDADMSYRLPAHWARSMARLQTEPHAFRLLSDFHVDVRSITLEEMQQLAREIFGNAEGASRYYTVPADYDGALPGEPADAATGQ